MKQMMRSRAGAVIAGAGLLALLSGGGAVGKGMVGSGGDAVGAQRASGSVGKVVRAHYFDRVLTTSTETHTETPAFCPAGTQVLTGFVLPGGTASYYLGGMHVEPKRNAFVVSIAKDMYDQSATASLTVRVVCLG